jgi:hypothetical protein
MKRIFTLAAAAAIGVAGAAFAAEPISQAEMEQAFKGKTFKFDDGSGNTGTISYGADGAINVKASSGPQSPEDSGTYRFAEGGYCSKWQKLRSGTEACFKATKVDGGGYQLWKADGSKDDLLMPQ